MPTKKANKKPVAKKKTPLAKVAAPRPKVKAKAAASPKAAPLVTAKLATAKVANAKLAKTPKGKAPAPAPSTRELGPTIDDYVSKVAPWQRTIIEKLRIVLKSVAPHAIESIKWGQPVYEHKGPFSYIKAHAAQVNFGFWRGAELEDPKRMLQGEGERMRHVKLVEAQIIDELQLGAFVKQAVALNDKKGDPTKG